MKNVMTLSVKCLVISLITVAAAVFFNAGSGEAAGDDKELGDKLLGQGKMHEHVEELQDLLYDRGYLQEEEDITEGVYDKTTEEAVTSFQEETDIYIDGLAGPQTIGALLILQQGDHGKVVLELQEDLQSLGYYNGKLDGMFGPMTHQAVKDFQADKGITVDGLAGPETYGTLHQRILSHRSQSNTESNNSTSSSSSSSSSTSSSQSSQEYKSESDTDSDTDNDPSSDTSSTNDNGSDSQSTSSNGESESSSKNGTTMTVEATAYTAYCDGCSGITYTGLDLRNNPDKKVIAVDPNVIPLGTMVHVEGYGTAVAGDIGGAIKGHKIDLFMPDRSDALAFGRRTIEITLLE